MSDPKPVMLVVDVECGSAPVVQLVHAVGLVLLNAPGTYGDNATVRLASPADCADALMLDEKLDALATKWEDDGEESGDAHTACDFSICANELRAFAYDQEASDAERD